MKQLKKFRMKFMDAAFTFRMPGGIPGDVNRSHPASIEPCLIDDAAPVTAYGIALLLGTTGSGSGSTQGVRGFGTGDSSGPYKAYGISVRPFPTQQSSGSNFGEAAFGSATPPVTGPMDVLRLGYITVKVNGTPKKGDPCYVFVAATSSPHTLGGFEATSGANIVALSNAYYNGVPDASGNVEVCVFML